MNNQKSAQLRKNFLNFFKERGHALLPSSPTVPLNDPTLLFTNAGMNQFKELFLGKEKRDYARAVTSQKCIRVGGKHNDLDNVGHTSRHTTFFEMLGNFSFGDYFKEEAIALAWEVTTTIFQFDPKRIWVSIFESDDEAFELWKQHIEPARIVRLGADENFWSMGATGPCGPCSELLYDRGERFGNANSPFEDKEGERFPEFWNLVFMESNREESGTLTPLPKKCVDTGGGLERILSFLEEKDSLFESDVLRALIGSVEALTGLTYNPADRGSAPAFHVIADHLRALAFAIADGAQPSNTERGYVLRKILRRAVRYGRQLNFNAPFLAKIFPTLLDQMGEDFPELRSAKEQIEEILTLEEESFFRTLKRGGNILGSIIDSSKKSAQKEIHGADAFKLKDTYGFPLEEILLIAKDSGLSVNLESYTLLEQQAKERSKRAHTTHKQLAESSLFHTFAANRPPTTFVGYEKEQIEASILGILVGERFVNQMETGEEGLLILDTTPFYAEKGGQVGDVGTLSHKKAHFTVTDCQTPYSGLIAHYGRLEKGTLLVGEPVTATIDSKHRKEVAKHHTATHLLHYALQQVCGTHIRQAGSLVEASKLRFDFNHHKPLSDEEIEKIEALVNAKIWEDHPLTTYEIKLEEVKNHPEIKQFFGDKYGSVVRVVDIDHFSKELCGGTHVSSLAQLGYFRISEEGSIAKGVRRIKGVLCQEAEALRTSQQATLRHLAAHLKCPPQQAEAALEALIRENGELKTAQNALQKREFTTLAKALIKEVEEINTISLLTTTLSLKKKEAMLCANEVMVHLKSGILLLAVEEKELCYLLLNISPDLVAKGWSAKTLIKKLSPLISGKGGGREECAQAGGNNQEGIKEAFEVIREAVRERHIP